MKGTIKWFNNVKGYGFITDRDGKDYFLHYSSLNGFYDEDGKLFPIESGDEVSFDKTEDEKGLTALNVSYNGAPIGKEHIGEIIEYDMHKGTVIDSGGEEFIFNIVSLIDNRDLEKIREGTTVAFRIEEQAGQKRAVRCVVIKESEKPKEKSQPKHRLFGVIRDRTFEYDFEGIKKRFLEEQDQCDHNASEW